MGSSIVPCLGYIGHNTNRGTHRPIVAQSLWSLGSLHSFNNSRIFHNSFLSHIQEFEAIRGSYFAGVLGGGRMLLHLRATVSLQVIFS